MVWYGYVIFVILQVKWQTVLWGIALQFVFALIVLRWQAGRTAFRWLGFRFTEFLGYSDFGAEFVFGASYREHMIAFQVILLLHMPCSEKSKCITLSLLKMSLDI